MRPFPQLYELERWLMGCCLSDEQSSLMRSILGLDQELLPTLLSSARRAWPEMAATQAGKLFRKAERCRDQALNKIKIASSLAGPEIKMLCHLDSFYKKLTDRFPGLPFSKIQFLANRFVSHKRSSASAVEVSRPTQAPGLKTKLPVAIADELKKKPGETFSQMMFRVFKLYAEIENGYKKQLFDAIVILNKFLVLKIANSYRSKIAKNSALSMDDLTQAGQIGVMKAIERYDYTRGFTFATYAQWQIRPP